VVGDSEEEPGNVGLLLEEGNLSQGEWMKVNILLVDNEESIRFSFSRFLAAEGHNVITLPKGTGKLWQKWMKHNLN